MSEETCLIACCFILVQEGKLMCTRVFYYNALYSTLASKARLLLSFSPKYCAEALRLSLSWDVNLGGAAGCALRFRWAPQESGSCTDPQAVIWFSKTNQHKNKAVTQRVIPV